LGGSETEWGSGIAVDAAGNALVTGGTDSSGWVSGGFDTSYGGITDPFVAKIIGAGDPANLPDLLVSALAVSRTSVKRGEQVPATFTVTNSGSVAAPATPARIRLASGTTITTSDPLLAEVTVGALAPGQSQTLTYVVTIPASTAGGNYYIGVTANATGPVQECDPNNNQRVTRITVTAQTGGLVETTATGFVYPTGRAGPYAGNMPGWLAGGPGQPPYWTGYYHLGQDMEANAGNPVYAIEGGEIVYVSTAGWGTGNYGILVRHWLANGQPFLALYGHVRPVRAELRYSFAGAVVPPIPVSAGEVLATVGPADHVAYDDVHLHFGIHPGIDVPLSNWGRMPLAQWPGWNGFVDPLAWLTGQTPRDPLGGTGLPVPAPTAPQNLVATAASSSTVGLSWQAGSANVEGFRIDRKVGLSGAWEFLREVASNVLSLVDNGLAALDTAYYRVLAYNGTGPSGHSNIASAMTPSGALPPKISKIYPRTPLADGSDQAVTIYGANFDTASPVVSLTGPDGNGFCPFVGSHSDTHITFVTNFGTLPGKWSVKVINPGGDFSQLCFVVGEAAVTADPTPERGKPWNWLGKWDDSLWNWDQANASRFSARALWSPSSIDSIVIHTPFIPAPPDPRVPATIDGCYLSTINTFKASPSDENDVASAHYVIGPQGQVTQMVDLSLGAHQATYYNGRSIGIEVAGWAESTDTWKDNAVYRPSWDALVNLVAWLAVEYNIPVVHTTKTAEDCPPRLYKGQNVPLLNAPGLVGHSQVQTRNIVGLWSKKDDPGTYFNWNEFVDAVQTRILFAARPLPTGSANAVKNAYFGMGWLTDWVNSAGTVETAPGLTSVGAYSARLKAQSPVNLSQSICTPEASFDLGFDYQFETTTGTLDVLLNSVVVATLTAPATLPAGPSTFSVTVTDPSLMSLENAVLEFRFNGPANSQMLLTNIAVQTASPVDVIQCGPGDTAVSIVRSSDDPPTATVSVTNSGVTRSYPLTLAGLPQLRVIGGDGDDELTVDFSNGNPLPGAGLAFDGAEEASGDRLIIQGATAGQNVTLTGSQVRIDGVDVVSTSNVEFLGFDVGDAPGGGLPGTTGLLKTGPGILVVSGPAAYAGGTTVAAGTLQVDSADALPAGGPLTIGEGATVILSSGLSNTAGASGFATATANVDAPTQLDKDSPQRPEAHREAVAAVLCSLPPAVPLGLAAARVPMAEPAKPLVRLSAATLAVTVVAADVRSRQHAGAPVARVPARTDAARARDQVHQAARQEPLWDQLAWLWEAGQSGFARRSRKNDGCRSNAVDWLVATGW
jgi:autotransporter-associated beta strand protein